MDDMAAYYPQAHPAGLHTYEYYQPPPPQPPLEVVVPPPPGASLPAAHHLHNQYVPHQQPMFASYGPPILPQDSPNEVRTLFIAGLPEDVKPREIYNLFREFPGYESSYLRNPPQPSQPFAFAVFANQQSAIMAMHAMNGMVFDLERATSLYIDLAKSNSRSKRTRIDGERVGADKRARRSALSRAPADSGVGSIHLPGMGNSAYNTNTIGYPSAQRQGNVDSKADDSATANLNNSSAPQDPQNVTPCPTLFVANLGPSCTEQELLQVFSLCPGFLKLKMQITYGAPVAFVDFRDVASSTRALNSLQGTILYSTPEGMRLEYAKSRMGMRKKQK